MGEALITRRGGSGDAFIEQYHGCAYKTFSGTTTQTLTKGNSVTVSCNLPKDQNNNLQTTHNIVPIEGFGLVKTTNMPLRVNGTLDNDIMFKFKNGETLVMMKSGHYEDGMVNSFKITTSVRQTGTLWYVDVVVEFMADSDYEYGNVKVYPIQYIFLTYTDA